MIIASVARSANIASMQITKLIGPVVGLLFALVSCTDPKPVTGNADSMSIDSVTPVSDVQYMGKDSELVLLAPEAYDTGFVTALLRSNLATKYVLDQDAMTIDGEKVTFRNDLKLNQVYTLKGNVGEKTFSLIVKRISNTTISYKLDESIKNGQPTTDEGKASLVPSFYLGSELDEDPEGNTYPADVYMRENGCVLDIRIGLNENGKVCAKLIRQCEDGSDNIDLDASPFLTE